jgi:hypothetical protein
MPDPTPSILQALDRRLLAAATLLQSEHKRDLSTTYPPASKPGQYPHARTLNLRDSVTVVKIRDGYRVGYAANAVYIVHLAGRGRRTIIDTAQRIGARLARIMRG